MHAAPSHPSGREPLFNIPFVVTASVLALVAVHGFRSLALSDVSDFEWLLELAVVPARWTAAWDAAQIGAIIESAGAGFSGREAAAREALARYVLQEGAAKPWTGLSYALLHGSWTHVLMNGVWLAAFGTPVARRCGGTRFLMIGALSALAGALAHVAIHPLSATPMIGASAAVSGWMAAAARFVFVRSNPGPFGRRIGEAHEARGQSVIELLRNRQAAIFLAVWFGTNLFFGLAATPLGIVDSSVAWEAHIGGFLAGLILFPLFDRHRKQA